MRVRLKTNGGYAALRAGDILDVNKDLRLEGYNCLKNGQPYYFFVSEVEEIEESDGMTWEKVKENFESQYPITESEAFKSDKHYNNENGSLYLFAQQHELNAWEFEVIKRIVRCRKKGEFISDIDKTKRVLDLYLKEQGEVYKNQVEVLNTK